MKHSNHAVRPHPQGVWRLIMIMALSIAAYPAAQAQTFNVVSSPNGSRNGDSFNAVTALSPSDVWAVGYKGQNEPLNGAQTLTEHFDGTKWTVIPSPSPNPTPDCTFPDNNLTGVSGASSSDVWAVGFNSSCTLFNPLILHWDGSTWKLNRSPTLNQGNNMLNGVLALAGNSVFAVGLQASGNGEAPAALIEHFNGSGWSVLSSPNMGSSGSLLSGIAGSASNDIWAVGNFVARQQQIRTLIEHFDGTKWSIIASPNALNGVGDQNVLLSVTATSATDATAVGFTLDAAQQRVLTLIERWNGTAWKIVPSANASSAPNTLNKLLSVSALSSTDVFAVGFFADSATLGVEESLIEHFDGSDWSLVSVPITGAAQSLNAVSALSADSDVWITGAFSSIGEDLETGLLIAPKSYVLFGPAQ